MATTMNIMQEDYASRLLVLGVGARYMIEAILFFHEPSGGYKGLMAGDRIQELQGKSPSLHSVLKTCNDINSMGNRASHLGLQGVTPSEKGALIDLSLALAAHMYENVRRDFEKDYQIACETLQRRKSSGVSANKSWWSVDAEETIYQYPTEMHIWLEDIGLSRIAPTLIGQHHVDEISTLFELNNMEYDQEEVQEIMDSLRLKLGDKIKFNKALKRLNESTLPEIHVDCSRRAAEAKAVMQEIEQEERERKAEERENNAASSQQQEDAAQKRAQWLLDKRGIIISGACGSFREVINGYFQCTSKQVHQAWQYEHEGGEVVLVYCEDKHWRIQSKAQVGTSACFAQVVASEPFPPLKLASHCEDSWNEYDLLDLQWTVAPLCLEAERFEGSLTIGSDNGQYSGELRRGKANGLGTCTWSEGWRKDDSYAGNFKDDKRHGQGKYTDASGDVYEGKWKDDKKHGQGKYTWADGGVYEGEYKDNKRHGQGKRTFADGGVYEGEWKDGMRHGQGKGTNADGGVYEGEYKDDKAHGQGKRTWPNGDVYEGEYKDGMRHGQGKCTWANGDVYEGEWKDDKKHGQG
jgi:hypothetical protein